MPRPPNHEATVTTKNAANGSAAMVVANPQPKNAHTAAMADNRLATCSQPSRPRLTINPSSSAHCLTAAAMSVRALLSFSPDRTVCFASNSVPVPITFRAEPTATLTGSTSAHRLAPAVPRTSHCLSLTWRRVTRSCSARWNSVAVNP